MAGKTLKRKRLFICFLTALLSVAVVSLVLRPAESVEGSVTGLKYLIRGDHPADSTIVIAFIDNESISTLGWPVKRNFYALMVSTLTELNVRAVGIEILFETESTEYPEYDDLLSGVIADAGNVVLPGYYRSVQAPEGDEEFTRGEGLHAPFQQLRDAAAGVGHLNFAGADGIPMSIGSDETPLDAFGLEVLNAGGFSSTVTENAEAVTLIYPGKISSFRLYPFLDILRSFDAVQQGVEPAIPIASLEGKIVLVGIVADGRSAFLSTPVDPRYPSIGVHAALIDNLLRNRFLTVVDTWILLTMTFLISLICVGLVLITTLAKSRILIGCLVIGTLIVSYLLFATVALQLPVAPLLLAVLISGSIGTWYKHRTTEERLAGIEEEKEKVVGKLRDREEKVRVLESELLKARSEQKAARTEELQSEILRFKEEIRSLSAKADDMVPFSRPESADEAFEQDGVIGGSGGAIASVMAMVGKVSQSDAPVLILGESGTGKELIARALHRRSNRSDGPFVAVNCGALSETLLESELFGHEKGAFTGAVKDRAGRFELASGGTIFLDEIGEVSESFQVKLLRVLQEGEFERVGGTGTVKVDVRVLAATNRDLKDRIASREFREDLYYRLNVLSIEIPSLRERRDDIPVLVERFLAREGEDFRVSRNVLDALQTYQWPGNVRELESVIKRGVLLAKSEGRSIVALKDLNEDLRASAEGKVALNEQILFSLREKKFSRSSISETASELGGLNRGTVAEYLRGQCLQAFVESRFDVDKCVQTVSLSTDKMISERLRKKTHEYLSNIVEAVDLSRPWEDSLEQLRSKKKNLPQRYHQFVDEVAEGFFRGLWKL